MRKIFKTLVMTSVSLLILDLGVAFLLAGPAPESLRRFFDYGTSVPGKIEQMKLQDTGLLQSAWLDPLIKNSTERFRAEPVGGLPVMRVYGMSFADDIAKGAQTLRPDLVVDMHGGPNAPPNFAYEAFLRDRPNRRAGDYAVLGILSASVPAMNSYSNRTWAFEQPAPFTYPVFELAENEGLRARQPVITSLEQEFSLPTQPELAAEWADQLQQDGLYSAAAFAWPSGDHSPFLRLARRALATRSIEAKKADIIADQDPDRYPYPEVLRRMLSEFSRMTHADGQIPIVLLIQSRDVGDPDLHELLAEGLDQADTPYLSTVTLIPVSDHNAFVADGHYTPDANQIFGEALLKLIDQSAP